MLLRWCQLGALGCSLLLSLTGFAAPGNTTVSMGNPPAKNVDFPLAAFLINETTHDVYVIPPEAAERASGNTMGFRFLPGVPAIPPINPTKLNSLETPLNERLGLLLASLGKRLGNARLDPVWAGDVMYFMNSSLALAKVVPENRPVWPPAVGLAVSSLAKQRGIMVVFSFMNGDKTSLLDKIDLARFEGGTTVRSYWSRNLNDPTGVDRTGEAIEKIVAHFQKSLSSPKPGRQEMRLRLAIDRRVSERDLSQIEAAVKGLIVSTNEALLIPIEVDRNDIRYQTPLEVSQAENLIAKIKSNAPSLKARTISNESALIQVQPAAKTKD